MSDPTSIPPIPCQSGRLKPCPFCGHEIEGKQPYWDDFDTDDIYWVIKCGYCAALIYSDSEEDVIEHWNRRCPE